MFSSCQKTVSTKTGFYFPSKFHRIFFCRIIQRVKVKRKTLSVEFNLLNKYFFEAFFCWTTLQKKNRWNLPGKWSYFHFSGNFLTKSGSNPGFEQAETSALPYLVYLPWRMKNRSDSGWFTWLHSDEQLLILGYIIFHRVFLSGSPLEFFFTANRKF